MNYELLAYINGGIAVLLMVIAIVILYRYRRLKLIYTKVLASTPFPDMDKAFKHSDGNLVVGLSIAVNSKNKGDLAAFPNVMETVDAEGLKDGLRSHSTEIATKDLNYVVFQLSIAKKVEKTDEISTFYNKLIANPIESRDSLHQVVDYLLEMPSSDMPDFML